MAKINLKAVEQRGRRIIIAVCLGAFFMVIAAGAFAILVLRGNQVVRGVRESAIWGAYQLDHESMRFAIALMANSSADDKKAIRQRFDILYSRTGLLERGHFATIFDADEDFLRLVDDASRSIKSLASIIDDPSDDLSTGTIDNLRRAASDLQITAGHIVTAANTLNAERVTRDRIETVRLYWVLASCFGALAFIGGVIIHVLVRQVAALSASRTELQQMSAELVKKADEALAGSRAKSQFLATMSHEIRTPMNGVIGAAELLLESDLDGKQLELARMIGSCGEALLNILNDVLDYSKLEAGKLEVESAPFSLRETMQSVIAIMSPKAMEKDLGLCLNVLDEAHDAMIGDQGRIRQVLLNLVSNGIKFTQKGSVTMSAEVSDIGHALMLRFSVTDSGMGITPAALSSLFVEFNQLEASMSRRFGGTGLGLAICKRLVTMMGGTVGVESILGLGSRFWFEVPVMRSETLVAPHGDPVGTVGRPPRSDLNILVADDNDVNRRIMAQILGKMGHSVMLAADGEEAVQAVAAGGLDLVFMDLQMPGVDGFEATRRIRALPPPQSTVRVAALTANVGDDDRVACFAAGMDAFTTKPISRARLHAVITDLFPQAQPETLPAPGPAAQVAHSGVDEGRRDVLRQDIGDDYLTELDAQFALDLAGLVPEIVQSVADRDGGTSRAAIHTLCGAAANLGYDGIAQAAGDLGRALKGGASDERVSEAVRQLITASNSFRAALADRSDNGRTGDNEPPPSHRPIAQNQHSAMASHT